MDEIVMTEILRQLKIIRWMFNNAPGEYYSVIRSLDELIEKLTQE
jgi:hypothetical protein